MSSSPEIGPTDLILKDGRTFYELAVAAGINPSSVCKAKATNQWPKHRRVRLGLLRALGLETTEQAAPNVPGTIRNVDDRETVTDRLQAIAKPTAGPAELITKDGRSYRALAAAADISTNLIVNAKKTNEWPLLHRPRVALMRVLGVPPTVASFPIMINDVEEAQALIERLKSENALPLNTAEIGAHCAAPNSGAAL